MIDFCGSSDKTKETTSIPITTGVHCSMDWPMCVRYMAGSQVLIGIPGPHRPIPRPLTTKGGNLVLAG